MGPSPAVKKQTNLLSIISTNIRGLCPTQGKFKIDLLREKAEEENAAIIALTESHLNSGFHEGEVYMKGFGNFRADRTDGVRKGGIVTYVRDDISAGVPIIVSDSIDGI